jgi:Domain of unknown function (DUF4145)
MPIASDALPSRKQIFCNHCRTSSLHDCKADHYRDWEDPENFTTERLGYRLWICRGCERGTMEQYYWMGPIDSGPEDFESDDPYAYNDPYTYEYFPDRVPSVDPTKPLEHVPTSLNAIYREVILAFNVGANLLCAIGMRALIERICVDKGIEGKNLYEKINRMKDIPLPQSIVENLHHLRWMGNDSAHELNAEREELEIGIEICEHLLIAIYELENSASLLAELRATKQRASIKKHVEVHGKIIPFKKLDEAAGQPPDV